MDKALKEEILRFFQKNRGYEITFPDDWTEELEKHLIEKGFDLENVIQWKKDD